MLTLCILVHKQHVEQVTFNAWRGRYFHTKRSQSRDSTTSHTPSPMLKPAVESKGRSAHVSGRSADRPRTERSGDGPGAGPGGGACDRVKAGQRTQRRKRRRRELTFDRSDVNDLCSWRWKVGKQWGRDRHTRRKEEETTEIISKTIWKYC